MKLKLLIFLINKKNMWGIKFFGRNKDAIVILQQNVVNANRFFNFVYYKNYGNISSN